MTYLSKCSQHISHQLVFNNNTTLMEMVGVFHLAILRSCYLLYVLGHWNELKMCEEYVTHGNNISPADFKIDN